MPLRRETGPKAKTWRELAVDQAIEEMLERNGHGPRALAIKARRLDKLVVRDSLTDDEQDELDALIIERRGDRWFSKHYGALLRKAETEWAERSSDPAFVAKWQRYAVDHKTNGGKPGEPKWVHWYWTITHSKEAKRVHREHRRYDHMVDKLRDGIEKREKARKAAEAAALEPSVESPATVPSPTVAAPTPAEVALAAEVEAAPRRKRQSYGIVMQTDQYGNRVD